MDLLVGLGVRLPFKSRLLSHLVVVVLVGSSAWAAHDQLFAAPQVVGLRPSVEMASSAPVPAPTLEALVSLPISSFPVAAAVAPVAGESGKASSSASSSAVDPLRQSLLYSIDATPSPNDKAQEDGVMVVRPVPSSRGGFRALEQTPSPTPTPAKKEPLKPQTYKVVSGDTLLGIAYKFGITPETILWANNMGNGDLLQIGEELIILPVSGVLHKVKKGDTLSGIANEYGADPEKIAEANALTDTNALQEGQELIVPGGMMRTTEPITGAPTTPSPQQLANAPKYVVKDGDTLLSIADAFGVMASAIQGANNLLDPNKLAVGQQLLIPGGKTPAAGAPTPAAIAKATGAPPPPPASSGSAGDRIAAIAQQYLGYRYVWGGTSPAGGFDCSGFAWYVYKEAGMPIPRAPLQSQLGAGARVSRSQLLPGDLVFWQNTYEAGLSHVGIYLGGGRFISAESESVGIQIRSLNDPFWSSRFYGASRPW